jgi:hypothetical protein
MDIDSLSGVLTLPIAAFAQVPRLYRHVDWPEPESTSLTDFFKNPLSDGLD